MASEEKIREILDTTTKQFHDAVISAMERTQHEDNAVPISVNLEPFTGRHDQDIVKWLKRFDNRLKIKRKRTDDAAVAAELAFALKGPAETWYNGLPPEKQNSPQGLRKALLERFASDDLKFVWRQQLTNRKLKTNETMDDYIDDLSNLAQRLNLTDVERQSAFISGLPATVREYVYLRSPKSYCEAERFARLKVSVNQTLSGEEAIKGRDASENSALVKILEKLAFRQKPESGNLAAFQEQKLDRDDVRDIVRKELRAALRTQPVQTNFRPNFEERHPSQNSGGRRMNGPICYFCNRVGHIARNCLQRNSAYARESLDGRRYQGFHRQHHRGDFFKNYGPQQTERDDDFYVGRQGKRDFCENNYPDIATMTSTTSSQSHVHSIHMPRAFTVSGSCLGYSAKFLLDTGAKFSVINKAFFDQCPLKESILIQKPELASLTTISGEVMPIWGKISLNITIDHSPYHCEAHIINTQGYDFVLGGDFLINHCANIDIVNNILTLKRHCQDHFEITKKPPLPFERKMSIKSATKLFHTNTQKSFIDEDHPPIEIPHSLTLKKDCLEEDFQFCNGATETQSNPNPTESPKSEPNLNSLKGYRNTHEADPKRSPEIEAFSECPAPVSASLTTKPLRVSFFITLFGCLLLALTGLVSLYHYDSINGIDKLHWYRSPFIVSNISEASITRYDYVMLYVQPTAVDTPDLSFVPTKKKIDYPKQDTLSFVTMNYDFVSLDSLISNCAECATLESCHVQSLAKLKNGIPEMKLLVVISAIDIFTYIAFALSVVSLMRIASSDCIYFKHVPPQDTFAPQYKLIGVTKQSQQPLSINRDDFGAKMRNCHNPHRF